MVYFSQFQQHEVYRERQVRFEGESSKNLNKELTISIKEFICIIMSDMMLLLPGEIIYFIVDQGNTLPGGVIYFIADQDNTLLGGLIYFIVDQDNALPGGFIYFIVDQDDTLLGK